MDAELEKQQKSVQPSEALGDAKQPEVILPDKGWKDGCGTGKTAEIRTALRST